MIEKARQDLFAQADPDSDFAEEVAERYPGAIVRSFDGNPAVVSEMDAIVAYLQVLGTMVDFATYNAEDYHR